MIKANAFPNGIFWYETIKPNTLPEWHIWHEKSKL